MEGLIGFLGASTALSAMATFFTCRSCNSLLGTFRVNLNESGLFRNLYRLHTPFWIIFGVSLVTHLAVTSFAVVNGHFLETSPSHGFLILWLGAASFLMAGSLLLSCRVYPRFFSRLTGRNPMSNKVFTTFFKLHSYMWIVLILLVLFHISLGEGLD